MHANYISAKHRQLYCQKQQLNDWAMFQAWVTNYASRGISPHFPEHVYLHHGPTSTWHSQLCTQTLPDAGVSKPVPVQHFEPCLPYPTHQCSWADIRHLRHGYNGYTLQELKSVVQAATTYTVNSGFKVSTTEQKGLNNSCMTRCYSQMQCSVPCNRHTVAGGHSVTVAFATRSTIVFSAVSKTWGVTHRCDICCNYMCR